MVIVTIHHQITIAEGHLLLAIHDYVKEHSRSPKAHEVGGRSRRGHAASPVDVKAFNALVVLGLLHHFSNGHCHLTIAGREAVDTLRQLRYMGKRQ